MPMTHSPPPLEQTGTRTCHHLRQARPPRRIFRQSRVTASPSATPSSDTSAVPSAAPTAIPPASYAPSVTPGPSRWNEWFTSAPTSAPTVTLGECGELSCVKIVGESGKVEFETARQVVQIELDSFAELDNAGNAVGMSDSQASKHGVASFASKHFSI